MPRQRSRPPLLCMYVRHRPRAARLDRPIDTPCARPRRRQSTCNGGRPGSNSHTNQSGRCRGMLDCRRTAAIWWNRLPTFTGTRAQPGRATVDMGRCARRCIASVSCTPQTRATKPLPSRAPFRRRSESVQAVECDCLHSSEPAPSQKLRTRESSLVRPRCAPPLSVSRRLRILTRLITVPEQGSRLADTE